MSDAITTTLPEQAVFDSPYCPPYPPYGFVSHDTRKTGWGGGEGEQDECPRSFCRTDNPDDVPVLQLMGILHPHLCPGINGIQESLTDISMHHERKIAGS